MQTSNSKVLGVIFDTSLRHVKGKRVIDHFKTSLIDYIRSEFVDDDIFYLFHPQIIETMTLRGEQVSAISNYETDGWKFRLNYALEQTLYVLDAEHEDFKKYLILFTDRFDAKPIERLSKIKERQMIDCELLVFTIGDSDPHKMSLCEVGLIDVKDVEKIKDQLMENLKYGHNP